jgi:hypothetical protein
MCDLGLCGDDQGSLARSGDHPGDVGRAIAHIKVACNAAMKCFLRSVAREDKRRSVIPAIPYRSRTG